MTITISIPQIVINISNTQNLNLEQMAHTIDELIAEVQRSQSLADGVKATIGGLRKQVADAIANAGAGISDAELAAIQQEVDQTFSKLAASNDEVAAALTENTTPAPTDGSTTPPVVPPVTTPPTGTGDGSTTTPTPDPTPAPVDTTPAPPVVDTPAPVDVTPAPVDSPATPVTPSTPTGPTAPTGPVTNPDGSTVI